MTNLIESVAKALKLKATTAAYLVVVTSAGLFLLTLRAQVQINTDYIAKDEAGERVQDTRLVELEKADALDKKEQDQMRREQDQMRRDISEIKDGIKSICEFLLQQQHHKKP